MQVASSEAEISGAYRAEGLLLPLCRAVVPVGPSVEGDCCHVWLLESTLKEGWQSVSSSTQDQELITIQDHHVLVGVSVCEDAVCIVRELRVQPPARASSASFSAEMWWVHRPCTAVIPKASAGTGCGPCKAGKSAGWEVQDVQ